MGMSSSNLVISKIGPDSDVVLRNLFEHYMHDMAEWFEIDTKPDGSYSYDTSLVWANGYDAYLAKIGDSIAGFAITGSAVEWLGDTDAYDVHEFLLSADFEGAASGEEWQRFFGRNTLANGSSECSIPTRQPSFSGEPRFRATRAVPMRRICGWLKSVRGDSSGSYPMAVKSTKTLPSLPGHNEENLAICPQWRSPLRNNAKTMASAIAW
jgi:hypothetical protein